MQYAQLEFKSNLLFTTYPHLDRLLKSNESGIDIIVPAQGIWHIRPSSNLECSKFIYANKFGKWDITLQKKKVCALLKN